jgi:hypothetical protein
MFLRKTPRKKDGKTHDYWGVVENKRVADGRVVQRHVLYLGSPADLCKTVRKAESRIESADIGRLAPQCHGLATLGETMR